jgi:hypothetical protein
MTESRLSELLTVGRLQLSHRIGMCPLTRFRASDDHDPLPFVETYYAQRSSVPGTLLVSEGRFISPGQGGSPMFLESITMPRLQRGAELRTLCMQVAATSTANCGHLDVKQRAMLQKRTRSLSPEPFADRGGGLSYGLGETAGG